jgi:hypothetical protein
MASIAKLLRVLLLGAIGLPWPSLVGAQVPSTDIWLAPLSIDRPSARKARGQVSAVHDIHVGDATNVTRRLGYDNQPRFTGDGKSFLYTRSEERGGTDIYRYDIAAQRSLRLTETLESEYSPTPMGRSQEGFCAVRVEADSTQRLWRFNSNGSDPRLVMAHVDSVGYFEFLDKNTVALFVVGEPHTLRLVDVASELEVVEAADIGRALLRSPRGGLTFLVHVPQSDPPTYEFFSWTENRPFPTLLVPAYGTGQDAVWIGETLVMADGSTLYATRPFESPSWLPVVDLGPYGLSAITRITASPDKKWLAIVGADPE